MNHTSQPTKDTIDQLGAALIECEGLTRVHRHMKSLPNYANKDAHYSQIERRIKQCQARIELLSSQLILGF